MFTSIPTYDVYRTLKLADPYQRGEDVYALQTAIKGLGIAVDTDGILGPLTSKAIKDAQTKLAITVDGLAGGGTQAALCKKEANEARSDWNLPLGLVFGQVSHESSCRVGNYSSQRSDGSFDAGAAQRNSAFYDLKDSFTVPFVIDFLGEYLSSYHRLYAGVSDSRRRWELSAGAWNAPAFAGRIATEEGASVPSSKPSWWPARIPYTGKASSVPDSARVKIEAYMDSVTAYMQL